jgi:hypothetical protein
MTRRTPGKFERMEAETAHAESEGERRSNRGAADAEGVYAERTEEAAVDGITAS